MEPSHGFNKKSHSVLDVLGPTVKFLVLPSECAGDYCVIRGTIPPGVSVPLHSHPDRESFFLLSGSVQALEQRKNAFKWINMKAGDFRHVASEVRHAWKNEPDEPAVAIIVTTPRLGRFFQEAGRPVPPDASPQAPSPRMFNVSLRSQLATTIGLASPEENAAVGINLSA
ncbi:MAG TPA: cupin domain-containing protein [Candidatus Dormibacteraeota bacterium]|nr:cupin domain-containing protein [Candidatus Dormibacteraeota bacterium]